MLPEHDLRPPPDDYQLLLPDGWYRIPLEAERCRRSVDALVKKQFSGIDDAPHVRELLRKELLEQASSASEAGGIELYISLQQAGALTVPASLLITLMTPNGPDTALPSPSELAEDLRGSGAEGRTVSVVELAAGTAVRVRVNPEATTRKTQRGEEDYALPSVTVDYHLRIPRSDMHLLLTFSTPLVQIGDAMVELFDAIAGSLVWQEH